MRTIAPNPWDEMYPFATCLGVASHIAAAFKQVLLQDKDLAHYAGDVQFVADTSDAAVKKSPRYHCLTMLRCRESVIVIDISAQHPAFKLDLGTIWGGPSSVVPFQESFSYFSYAYVDGPRGTRMLVDWVWPSSFKGPFFDVKGGVKGDIADYAIPAANANDTPLGPMSRRRNIEASSVWHYHLLNGNVYFHLLDSGKYLVNSISVRINIINQSITL
jgi:hypothetical protein